jgi:hypothetical protein
MRFAGEGGEPPHLKLLTNPTTTPSMHIPKS